MLRQRDIPTLHGNDLTAAKRETVGIDPRSIYMYTCTAYVDKVKKNNLKVFLPEPKIDLTSRRRLSRLLDITGYL